MEISIPLTKRDLLEAEEEIRKAYFPLLGFDAFNALRNSSGWMDAFIQERATKGIIYRMLIEERSLPPAPAEIIRRLEFIPPVRMHDPDCYQTSADADFAIDINWPRFSLTRNEEIPTGRIAYKLRIGWIEFMKIVIPGRKVRA